MTKRQPAGTASSIVSRTNGEKMNDRSTGAFGLIPVGQFLKETDRQWKITPEYTGTPPTPATLR